MKKIILVLFAAIVAFSANAQAGRFGTGQDSVECVKYLSYYREYMKHNNIAEATSPWRNAFAICPPTASENMILDGQKIMRSLISKSKDAKLRAAYIDTLLMLADLRAEVYPKNAVKALNNKVKDINNFKWNADNPEVLYAEYERIFKANGQKADPLVFAKYMETSAVLFGEGKLDADAVMEDYTAISEALSAALTVKADEQMQKAQKDVETIFANSGVASCENLITLLTPRYEAAPEDKDVLSGIVKLLGKADCLDTDLYIKSAEALYNIEPSSTTAYFLYRLYSRRDDVSNASRFLSEAIATCDEADPTQLAEYLLESAKYNYIKVMNNAAAVRDAKRAAELSDAQKGQAYLLIANVWRTMKCVDAASNGEIKAHLWVAYDYALKAKAADPSLAEEAGAIASQCQANFPNSADAFMYDLTNGKAHTVSCGGLSESTTVKTAK